MGETHVHVPRQLGTKGRRFFCRCVVFDGNIYSDIHTGAAAAARSSSSSSGRGKVKVKVAAAAETERPALGVRR